MTAWKSSRHLPSSIWGCEGDVEISRNDESCDLKITGAKRVCGILVLSCICQVEVCVLPEFNTHVTRMAGGRRGGPQSPYWETKTP